MLVIISITGSGCSFVVCFACLGLEFVVVTVVGEWGGGTGEGVFSGRLGGGVQVRESFQGGWREGCR